MKKAIISLLLITLFFNVWSQTKKIDSINRLIGRSTSDTQRINRQIEKLQFLSDGNLDTAIAFGRGLLAESKKIGYLIGEAKVRLGLAGNYSFAGNYTAAKNNLDSARTTLLHTNDALAIGNMYGKYGMMYSMQNKFGISHVYYQKGIDIIRSKKIKTQMLSSILQNNAIAYQQESNYSMALSNYQQALKSAEELNDVESAAFINLNLGITYEALREKEKAEQLYLKAIEAAKKLSLKNVLAYAYANIASLYADQNKVDKQYDFAIKAAALGEEIGDKGIQASSLSRAATALAKEKKFEEAIKLNNKAIIIAESSNQPYNIFQTYSEMGFILKSENNYSKAIPYFEKAFHSLAASDIYSDEVAGSYTDLSECYEKTGNFNKALSVYKIATKITDSIKGKENIKKATELRMNYDFEKQQQVTKEQQAKKDADNKRIKNQQIFVISILGLIVLAAVIIASIQFKNNRQRQRAYNLLQKQKRETDNERQKTEKALSELKLTQSQLIQSAKMASLGELTAGIAHEIQNPLNFVNNFSELNCEMLGELKAESRKPKADRDEQLITELINDVIKNEEKINHHGKRADGIVKGMLEHSRTTSGQKELTDLNKLADEYLRLAYHGLRAKDKHFNAELITRFDNNLPKADVVPQDIGRVFLNIFNNAFYAISQKLKTAGPDYKPEVTVITSSDDKEIAIKVTDNGTGISDDIRDKIMQPFFTTKPTGEGTGLGLSLSYDIVVKGHGGEIDVNSVEGKSSEFIITFPIG